MNAITFNNICGATSYEETIREARVNGFDFNKVNKGDKTLLEQFIENGPHQSLVIALTLIKYGAVLTGDMLYHAEKKTPYFKLTKRLSFHLSPSEYARYLTRKTCSEDVCLSDICLTGTAALWGKERAEYFNAHFPTTSTDPVDKVYVERMGGANYNVPVLKNGEHLLPLEHAITAMDVILVKALILHGANVTDEVVTHAKSLTIVTPYDDDDNTVTTENEHNSNPFCFLIPREGV